MSSKVSSYIKLIHTDFIKSRSKRLLKCGYLGGFHPKNSWHWNRIKELAIKSRSCENENIRKLIFYK